MSALPPEEINARQGFVHASEGREGMDYDVVIVGAGPAGLAAAIRLRQLAEEGGKDISVCVLEKGSEVGAHILSGAVMDPAALTRLLPKWKEEGAPLNTPVKRDVFHLMSAKRAFRIPNIFLPPMMKNHKNYIISLSNLCRWLGQKAEAMGVEIYAGFAAAEVLFDDDGRVRGVATGDMGIGKNGEKKDNYTQGVEINGKYVLFAEGARGSLTKFLIQHFKLDEGRDPQKYGIGLKELWRVDPKKHHSGLVQHSLGWPMGNKAGGGGFIYHLGEDQVSVGFVIALDYQNPYFSPFDEFQRFKTHPAIRDLFIGGERLGYGARAVTQGGAQSVPKLIFPGGALIGCAAGFMNVPRIKGSHNAIMTGMLAADAAADALGKDAPAPLLDNYPKAYKASAVHRELRRVRNVKPLWARFGIFPGIMIAGIDMWLRSLFIHLPITFRHKGADYAALKPARGFKKIDYPKPDGKISFDKLSSVFLSGTNHGEDQPAHLTLRDPDIPVSTNLPEYDEPAQRYCPAGVYEIVDEGGTPRFQINAQNCVHCKTCDIKDPAQNINWVTPEGGGGPNYSNM